MNCLTVVEMRFIMVQIVSLSYVGINLRKIVLVFVKIEKNC